MCASLMQFGSSFSYCIPISYFVLQISTTKYNVHVILTRARWGMEYEIEILYEIEDIVRHLCSPHFTGLIGGFSNVL